MGELSDLNDQNELAGLGDLQSRFTNKRSKRSHSLSNTLSEVYDSTKNIL